ncbi:hypothetical protein PL373_16155 [Tenacibaculum maritimum]|nr:hypothetical protein [Tenacibaculum maritimum]MDB0602635.1 hypothetical protein [Tenacibaculum maritimum]MDB0611254.1 hypothetical protein [Tenacibaculum maritimum]
MKKDIFEQNQDLDVVYETSDGVNFYTEHNAETHAKAKLKNKKVTKRTRSEYLDSKAKEVAKRITAINKLTTVEEIEAAIEGEKSTKVTNAANKKIEELKKA